MQNSIFNYETFRDYMQVVYAIAKHGQGRLTLKKWGEKLGYRSHRSVAMVLKGDRAPSQEMTQRLADQFRLSPIERQYLELLVLKEKRQRRGDEFSDITRQLVLLRTRHEKKSTTQPVVLSSDLFSSIAEWHHIVLRQLARTAHFHSDPEVIRRRLRGRLSARTISDALKRMERLNLLARDAANELKATKDRVETTTDVASSAIRFHHQQMLGRAQEALTSQSVKEREFMGLTMTFDPKDTQEAKAYLREVADEFERRFANRPDQDEVYQLNIQFFGHTKPIPAEGKSS